MNPDTNPRAVSSASVSAQLNQPPSQSIFDESSARHRTSAFWLIPCAVLAVFALAFAADAIGQKPHPGVPYNSPDDPNPNGPSAQQYAQPAPQNNYAQPQYQPPATQQPYQDQPPQYAPQPHTDQTQAPYPQPDQSQAPAQALSAQDLEQLLAPIALYPDSLLAQILAASTYPAEVAIADQWVRQMRASGYGLPDQIAAGANAQTNWDPSIKALTAFPDVLDMLNHDLEWTTNLGNAYYNQPQDVMQTVQVLRQRAEQAGNLQSTPQEDVSNDQGYIDLAPTNPQVVYVPTYNPWDVYGQPIAPYPGFSFIGALGDFFGANPIQYGLSFALGAFDRMPFGWMAWGFDWVSHALMFDHSGYSTRSNQVADWGLPRGGPRAYGRGGSWDTRRNPYQASRGWQGYDQGGNYQRGGFSNNRGGARSYVRPTPDYSRTAPQQNYGYRPQTYPNREQTYMNRGYETRPQSYSNPGSSYGYAGRSNYGYTGPQAYGTRPNYGYSNPSGSYRAPQQYNPRGYSNRSYENYGNSAARNERSGGFHLFGVGTPKSFTERAPRYSSKAPKNFGGGHQSFGGGHEKAPKMSHSGGGSRRR